VSRLGALTKIPRTYLRTAWWGLMAPRFSEHEPLVVVQAVVLSGEDEEILLTVRADVRGWELPGGNLEPGETAKQALRREVQEETGLDVEVGGHVGDYTRTGFRPHVARVFRCRVREGELRPSRETPRVQWWSVGELPATLFSWYHRPIADALANGPNPVARSDHQGVAVIARAVAIDLRMRWTEEREG
jgi:8-oxo-dGTP diphosphatase